MYTFLVITVVINFAYYSLGFLPLLQNILKAKPGTEVGTWPRKIQDMKLCLMIFSCSGPYGVGGAPACECGWGGMGSGDATERAGGLGGRTEKWGGRKRRGGEGSKCVPVRESRPWQ